MARDKRTVLFCMVLPCSTAFCPSLHIITQTLASTEQPERKTCRALLSTINSSGLSGKESRLNSISAGQEPGKEEVAVVGGSSLSPWGASLVVLKLENLIPGSGRSPGEGNGNPLQYPCLENSMDRAGCRLQSKGSHRVRHNWAVPGFSLFHFF